MHHILAARHFPTLASFAVSNALIGFDYDGTLAPIVRSPTRAAMRPATRRLLTAVSERYPSVVISGRARSDLVRRVGAVPVWHLAGNHGLEPWNESTAYTKQVSRWVQELQPVVARCKGVLIENKLFSITIHYRHSPNKTAVLRTLLPVCRRLRDARLLHGHYAISLVPAGAPHKGAALDRARRLLACDTAIYLGDDGTDEDAFRLETPERLLAIRVGRDSTSRAKYYLTNQKEVDRFLRTLVTLRPLRNGRSRPRLP